MERISLNEANQIVAAALAHASSHSWKPLAIVILDAGGHVVSAQRQDGATSLRVDVARGKASGALSLGMSSRKIADVAAERPSFFAAVATLNASGIVPAPGGVIVVNEDGEYLGAVGVSGDTSDNDEECAIHGITTAGLRHLAP